MKKRTLYYTDELSDDFAGTRIETKPVPANFKYVHRNPFWRFAAFVLYRLIVLPAAWLIGKVRYGTKIKNKKLLKQVKGRGCFLYANHTLVTGDAFHPNVAVCPRKAYIVVGADTVSIRGFRNIVAMLGAIPLPSGRAGYRAFTDAISLRVRQKQAVVIYPEAHIWPYYTGIRPFGSESFFYPVKAQAPVFALTTVHKKRRFRTLPKCELYFDGPFYPDPALSVAEQKQALRDEVYAAMTARAALSDYDRVRYVKRESAEEEEAEKEGETENA